MSTPPPPQARRSAGEAKKTTPPTSSIVTRNGARKAKIQTRAMSAGAKPSASLLAAKKKALQKKKQTLDTVLRDPYQTAMESKNLVKGPTGFVTEPRMAEHHCLWDSTYPECPERLIGVIDRCKELNLIDQCKSIPPRAATKEELNVLHSDSVYELLETTHQNNNAEYLEEISSRYDAVYIHPSTHSLALLAAGATIDLVDRVASGELQNGAAFVRPPGHHAMRAEPCGYCFYNNVALAAKHAIDKRGLNRILIVDWDVHHGQATQQMFYDSEKVVYFSIHRYEHGAFWPNLRQSDFHYVGAGRGRGRNFNVPLNATGMADHDYLAVWHQLLLPMALEFSPEMVIVSAGYDAALGDEKGEMEVSPACYATLTQLLMGVCPAVVAVLEGGYCVPSLAEGAALTLRALLGYAPPPPIARGREPSDQIRETILNCIYAHKPYWSCYNYQLAYSTDESVPNVCDGQKEKHIVAVRWEGDETRPESYATRDCYPVQDDAMKRGIMERLDRLRIETDLSLPQHAVGYIYDPAMLKHRNICEPGHVECPERIMRIHERHRDFGLLERVHELRARAATDTEILHVTTDTHLSRLKELSSTKLRDLNSQKNDFDSVYFHPDSLESASVAVGCVLEMTDAVVSGVVGSGVCVVRPPGHHADGRRPRGFCLLNNAAAAAARATARGVGRVLLLDWDVHHGDGTQALTYDDPGILYMSVHRYEHGAFFPHAAAADYTAVGGAAARGYNVNIPWNKRGMGDAEYLSAFTQVVLPIAAEFAPQLVVVSAGFDACVGDPLGGCKVTPECFGRMTHFLRTLAGGKLVLCLEGGYNGTSIACAMAMCTKALLGDPLPPPSQELRPCHWSAVESINNVIRTHKKYWKSLKFQLALPVEHVLSEPLPSRGLVAEDRNVTTESEKLAELSLSSSDASACSKSACQMEMLESHMTNLTLDKAKCEDGVHCGTDDEEEKPECSKKREEKPCERLVSDQAGSSKSGREQTCSAESSSDNKTATLVDYLAENMQAIVDGEMFAVIPLPWCPHLETLGAIPTDVKFEQGMKCVDCEETAENWVCLHCFITACGRSINGHMQRHYRSAQHPLALSMADLSAWCSACDAYVDNPALYNAKNNAHRCKFNEDMPWCYRSDTLDLQTS